MDFAVNPSPGFRNRPEHTISVMPFKGVVVITFGDVVLASSKSALLLKEADYSPVYYVPFKDVDFELLQPSDATTHCPFKGDAAHWSASASGEAAKNVMWAYRHPYDEMTAIKDHGAFYANKVRIEATPDDGQTVDL